MLTKTASWFGRKALLYLMLVVAIGLSTVAIPRIRQVISAPGINNTKAAEIDRAVVALGQFRNQSQARLDASVMAAGTATDLQIDQELRAAETARIVAIGARRSAASREWSVYRLDTNGIVADRSLELEIELRTRQIAFLKAAKARSSIAAEIPAVAVRLSQKASDAVSLKKFAEAAEQACHRTKINNAAFNKRWAIDRLWREAFSSEGTELENRRRNACTSAEHARARYDAAARTVDQIDARLKWLREMSDRTKPLSGGQLNSAVADLVAQSSEERQQAKKAVYSQLKSWAAEWHLDRLLVAAAIALLGILLVPLLIRLVCFTLLAPLAERRPGIHLKLPRTSAGDFPDAARSAPSVAVRLGAGEELLVRQGYLQSTSFIGGKRTRWLLDWGHPLSSLAAGLSFLVAIRGAGETTTVSAVHDALCEVTILTVPEGLALVLKPRAIAAVAQQIRQPMRISSKWRFSSLHAWLNLQFRYLIFHGPVRIVIKGNRGVRVERAESGRVFWQEQLVGFSVDLAYSISRTETFWPYLFGRESLLKDRVEAGHGVLIVEEAPMAGKRAGEVRHGIEGAIDAALKVVGL